jgi:hypothetical protein
MNQNKQATEEEQELMAQYGITHETKSVYFYQGHKYDNLNDAINYARDSLARTPDTATTPTA